LSEMSLALASRSAGIRRPGIVNDEPKARLEPPVATIGALPAWNTGSLAGVQRQVGRRGSVEAVPIRRAGMQQSGAVGAVDAHPLVVLGARADVLECPGGLRRRQRHFDSHHGG
jgi:hypothetical protein